MSPMSAHEKQLARARAKREAARKAAARKQRWRKTLATAVIIAVVIGVAIPIVNAIRQPDSPVIDQPTGSTSPSVPAVAACDPTRRPAPSPAPTTVFSEAPTERLEQASRYSATITTSCGRIVVGLDQARAPKTVENFIALARRDYYDGVIFHRVINGFVIQAGDPTGTGSGEPGYTIEGELEAAQADGYRRGTLAMANVGGDPNTASTQFFIVQSNDNTLTPDYATFGRVRRGMDVVDSIAAVEVDAADKPVQPVYIIDVEIEQSPPGDDPPLPSSPSPTDGGSPS